MFKDKLKQLRTERNLTQADIAKSIGVSAATIGNYEQGTREPRNNEMWQKLADYFGVTVDELMDKTVSSSAKNNNNIMESKSSYFSQFRTDKPLIYNGVDISSLIFDDDDNSPVTSEQILASASFRSRSGHVIFARRNLINILNKIKNYSKDEIISNLPTLTANIERKVIFWYKKCWCNMDDFFPNVSDMESLYDLLDICLSVDYTASEEFYLQKIPDNFDWLREKFH